jgi:hypothetical protein
LFAINIIDLLVLLFRLFKTNRLEQAAAAGQRATSTIWGVRPRA